MSRLLLLPPYQPGNTPNQPAAGQAIFALGSGNRVKGVYAPQVLFQGATPIGVASSGSIANNGALTGLTPFLITYSDIYLWFPANAIAAGVAAGFYYCQMSSTTVGTIFNNTYTTGVPTVPASPVAFVTTGPGAYAGATGEITGLQFTIPANTMGPRGKLRTSCLVSNNNSAGTKNPIARFGGNSFVSSSNTTQQSQWVFREIMNRKTNKQVTAVSSMIGPTGSNGAPQEFAIDTTAAVALQLNLSNNTATDWSVYEYYSAEVIVS